jgi:hypothetical protein
MKFWKGSYPKKITSFQTPISFIGIDSTNSFTSNHLDYSRLLAVENVKNYDLIHKEYGYLSEGAIDQNVDLAVDAEPVVTREDLSDKLERADSSWVADLYIRVDK